MSIITRIHNINDRVDIYIDGKYCRSINSEIWEKMHLPEGWRITCSDLARQERLCRNQTEVTSSCLQRKRRLDVEDWITKHLPELGQKTVPRSVNNNIRQNSHEPNLILFSKKTQNEIVTIKVIGIFAGDKLRNWIKKKTLEYVKNNLDRDVWIADCSKSPTFSINWLKPIIEKEHITRIANENNICAYSHYSGEKFVEYIRSKLTHE